MFHVRYLCSCGFGALLTVADPSQAPKERQCQVCHSMMKAESLGSVREEQNSGIMDTVRESIRDTIKNMSEKMMDDLVQARPVTSKKPLTDEEFADLVASLMKDAKPVDVKEILGLDKIEGIQPNPFTEKVPFLGIDHHEF